MPVRGTLTKQQARFLDAALRPAFPEAALFLQECDADGVQVCHRARRWHGWCRTWSSWPTSRRPGWSSLLTHRATSGPYDEVVLFLDVSYKGKPFQFAAFLYVTTDAAMAAGREMGGYPKKIGRIEFLPGPARTAVLERPAGLRLCTGTMRPEQLVVSSSGRQKTAAPPAPVVLNYLTLRLIPSPQAGQPPTVARAVGDALDDGPRRSVDRSRLVPVHRRLGARPAALGPGRRAPMSCELITGDICVDLNDQPSETPL